MLVRASGEAQAVEVEQPPKRDRTEYDRKFAWYQGQLDSRLSHWFVPSFTLRVRLKNLARPLWY